MYYETTELFQNNYVNLYISLLYYNRDTVIEKG